MSYADASNGLFRDEVNGTFAVSTRDDAVMGRDGSFRCDKDL